MSMSFRPLNKNHPNYLAVIHLYKEAFPKANRIPTFLLRYRLRKGKEGFNVIYEKDSWIGLVYFTHHRDIVFVHFLAISERYRSRGYGSLVLEALGNAFSDKRIVLNIEEIDEQADNLIQRRRRKAFYEKNGFVSTGFIVIEAGERQEMLVRGGNISAREVESMYEELLGRIVGFFVQPKISEVNQA